MLPLTITQPEGWDEVKEQFVPGISKTIQLEHSLVSISKWEAKWKIPFLRDEPMTDEQTLDYIRCMTITQNVDPEIYTYLTNAQIQDIVRYINDPMTATTVYSEENRRGKKEVVTSELIDYWMIALNIPVEFRKWHLNRLLTLIRVCQEKNKPQKKRKFTRDDLARRRALNEARKAQWGTKG